MPQSSKKPNTLIVLPTLGRRIDYLKKTLKSIESQTHKGYDLTLIYPLDNKEVQQLAKKYGATSVADPGGLSSALNVGIKTAKAHHKYISWIGDDDLLTEKSLELATEALDNNPDAPVAFGNCTYIDKDGKDLFISKAGKIVPWLMTWGPNLLPCPGSLFRKKDILKVGGFDEQNKHSMDLDIFLKLKKLGRFVYVNQTLAAFRWHDDSLSVGSRDAATKEAEAVKRKFTPAPLKVFTPIWFIPIRYASALAAKKLSKR